MEDCPADVPNSLSTTSLLYNTVSDSAQIIVVNHQIAHTGTYLYVGFVGTIEILAA